MKHAIIQNIPKNPRAIYDAALAKAFDHWVDEKGTKDNPGHFQRKPSKLTYEEAFEIIQNNHPHWVISFRNESYISSKLKDYWEFGGGNIGSSEYGSVFIWIKLDIEDALKIFQEFDLIVKEY